MTESEARIELDQKGFFEKRLINMRKRWILDGLDPDEEQKKFLKKKKKFNKKNKKEKTESKTEVEIT